VYAHPDSKRNEQATDHDRADQSPASQPAREPGNKSRREPDYHEYCGASTAYAAFDMLASSFGGTSSGIGSSNALLSSGDALLQCLLLTYSLTR